MLFNQDIISLFQIIRVEIEERNLNFNNKTPLHIAAQYDSNKIGELLILKGPNVNIKVFIIIFNHDNWN